MNTTPGNQEAETELRRQYVTLFRELNRLFNAIMNCLFSLTQQGTQRRRNMLIGLFLLIGFFFGFFSREASEWRTSVQNVLIYLFNPVEATRFNTNPVLDFLQLILNTYWPEILRFLPVFVLPFILAWQSVASYLADIFDLQDVSIARTFIREVAITGGSRKIRVLDGEIDQESEKSPVFLIGGPGAVIVELDSAALFERSDGRPQVIGPTVEGPVVLEGFERFRQAINIRDHRTETLRIPSRSLDGIPVHAEDVSFLFSVHRGNNQPPSVQRPYPYANNKVIESLIYNQSAKVKETGPRPADISKAWAGTMTSMIKNGLASFMSDHNLTEYLANLGEPEILTANEFINSVLSSARRVLPPEGPLPVLGDQQNAPPFTPRPDIRDQLFGEFAVSFSDNAAQKGVELHWVGIGSWKTPSQIVPEQHLEAWQLSMDNQTRRGRTNSQPYVTKFIQDVPLTRFNENRQKPHQEVMLSLLIGYREQYIKILTIMDKEERTRNYEGTNTIIRALHHINQMLGWSDNFPAHWVGGNGDGDSPSSDNSQAGEPTYPTPGSQSGSGLGAPSLSYYSFTPEEYILFINLVTKTRNVPVAERLIEYERNLAPQSTMLEIIQRVIDKWERDNH